jgi:hypothetical protein
MSSDHPHLPKRSMNVRRVGFLAAAVVLTAAPAGFGASPPRGSHGQETDRPVAGSHAVATLAASASGRTARVAHVSPPRGSHGQETDRPTAGTQAVATLAAYAPGRPIRVAFANPPKGSHGQETDRPHQAAHAVRTLAAFTSAAGPAAYSRVVTRICGSARLFEQSHAIGTREGALAVADDIRATTGHRLALVAALPALAAQRAAVARWLALEQQLASAYALGYVQVYDLVAAPRSAGQDTAAARRLATIMHAPDRLKRAAAGLERQLHVPDCTGGG